MDISNTSLRRLGVKKKKLIVSDPPLILKNGVLSFMNFNVKENHIFKFS